MASMKRLLSTKSTNMGSTCRDLAQPRLNICSGEAQLGAKMGQHGPKMAPLGRRWSPRGPNFAQHGPRWSLRGSNMSQQGRKIVKHASALLIFSVMSQNIVFPPQFLHGLWRPAVPKMSQDGLQMAQESAKIGPREPSWSEDEPNMTPR